MSFLLSIARITKILGEGMTKEEGIWKTSGGEYMDTYAHVFIHIYILWPLGFMCVTRALCLECG